MTALALSKTPPFFVPANPSYGGTSISAIHLNDALRQARQRWEEAATNRHSDLEDQLFSIIEECRVTGWDGYGAQPISPMALTEAKQLLAVIPKRLLPHEIVAEPHGGIAFQWNASDNRCLVISTNGAKVIEFAAIYGPVNQDIGKRSFSGLLPSFILDLISTFQE